MSAAKICEACPRWVHDEIQPLRKATACPRCGGPLKGRTAFVIRRHGEEERLGGAVLRGGESVEYLCGGTRWLPAVIVMKPWSGGTRFSAVVIAGVADVSSNPVRIARREGA